MTAVEWLSNQAYELFEQYSEGNFDRIQLNKFMVDATKQGKEMEKEQTCQFISDYIDDGQDMTAEEYYEETFKPEKL
jgi:hypothetical protein